LARKDLAQTTEKGANYIRIRSASSLMSLPEINAILVGGTSDQIWGFCWWFFLLRKIIFEIKMEYKYNRFL
jgi:hypothetical protein